MDANDVAVTRYISPRFRGHLLIAQGRRRIRIEGAGTGGLVELIARETAVIEILAPWLTLDGLRMIYEMNAQKASS